MSNEKVNKSKVDLGILGPCSHSGESRRRWGRFPGCLHLQGHPSGAKAYAFFTTPAPGRIGAKRAREGGRSNNASVTNQAIAETCTLPRKPAPGRTGAIVRELGGTAAAITSATKRMNTGFT